MGKNEGGKGKEGGLLGGLSREEETEPQEAPFFLLRGSSVPAAPPMGRAWQEARWQRTSCWKVPVTAPEKGAFAAQ